MDAGLVALEAAVGDAQDAFAVGLQPGVLAPVALDVLDDRVVRTAVEFEREPVLRPVAVDLPEPEPDVALRGRDLRVLQQPAVEGALQGGFAVEVRAGTPRRFCGRLAFLRGGVWRLRVHGQIGDVEQVPSDGLLDQLVKLVRGRARGGCLDQQSWDRADAQAVAGADLRGMRGAARAADPAGPVPGVWSMMDREVDLSGNPT